MNNQSQNHECCPKFDPDPWERFSNGKIKNSSKTKSLHSFHAAQLRFSYERLNAKVEKCSATIPDWLCLSDHTSGWNMDLYLAVDKEIPEAENISMSGKFFSKVYEGPFSNTKKWCTDFEKQIKERELNLKKMYLWYTTCPKCAKKYRKNYVVIIGNI